MVNTDQGNNFLYIYIKKKKLFNKKLKLKYLANSHLLKQVKGTFNMWEPCLL